jgi:hypothetical protein
VRLPTTEKGLPSANEYRRNDESSSDDENHEQSTKLAKTQKLSTEAMEALAAVANEADLAAVAKQHLNTFEKTKLVSTCQFSCKPVSHILLCVQAWTGLSSASTAQQISNQQAMEAPLQTCHRFDLDGKIVTSTTDSSIALYHHEDMNQLPGYSLQELLLLARSSVA